MSDLQKHTKYRFEIVYTTQALKNINAFMSNADLGYFEAALTHTMIFTSTSTHISVEDYKNLITEAYASDECIVLKIEGGKVE